MFMQKFRIDLKIPDLIFKINIKHFTNANPKSMIATVPLIEGNVSNLEYQRQRGFES